jgi:hypothetical protein
VVSEIWTNNSLSSNSVLRAIRSDTKSVRFLHTQDIGPTRRISQIKKYVQNMVVGKWKDYRLKTVWCILLISKMVFYIAIIFPYNSEITYQSLLSCFHQTSRWSYNWTGNSEDLCYFVLLDKWAHKHIKYWRIKIIGAWQSYRDQTKEPQICLNKMYRLK